MQEKRFKSLKRISIEDAQNYISAENDFKNNFIQFYTAESSTDSNYPSNDGWEKITYYTGRRKPKIKSLGDEIITPEGYIQMGDGSNTVYVMSNPSIPGLLKIGSTRNTVEERRKQLSSSSGVAEPFKIEWIFKLDGNEEYLEKEIHNILEHRRSNMKREFFDVSLSEAINTIKTIGKNYI